MNNKFKFEIIKIFQNHSLPRWFVLFIDITVVFLAFIFANLLRYNFDPTSFNKLLVFKQTLFVCSVYVVFMFLFKSYAGLIRQATIKDTFIIVVTCTLAFAFLFIVTLCSRELEQNSFYNISLSILMIHYGTVIVFLIFFRVFIKMFNVFVSIPSGNRKNVLIYGSGDAGIVVKRVIENDPENRFQLKGFIDDNIKLQGKKVDGYPVFSKSVLTKDFIDAEGIKVFIFAIKNISAAKKKEVLESLIDLGLEILDTPSFDQWFNGNLKVKQLRKVQLEDLLGREPITLNLIKIEQGLNGKTILVTGGTGSFGNAVLRRFLDSDIKEIRIFSRDEKKQDDMRHRLQNPKVKFYIGDVRSRQSVDNVMHGVDYIFSAAALKQVPSCEFFPMEAIHTNVEGTNNVLESAIEHGIKNVVVLSTDKAAYPINAMGISKAMMEKVAIAKGRQLGQGAATTICCTRYGNVMASRGSVIPLWVDQIRTGKPITITDPNMTRFMMTLDDAVDLVMYAFEHGDNGDLFIQKAPAVTLEILAVALKDLYNSSDTEIKVIGTRHGEKLYETLVTREEMAKAIDMGNYYRIPCDTRDLNYDKFFVEGDEEVSKIEDYHSHNTTRLDVEGMKELLLKLRFVREDLGLQKKSRAEEIRSE